MVTDDEHHHLIMRGNFDVWNLIPAIARLAESPIRELNIATLGFAKRNADDLIGMIVSGEVRASSFICLHFWKSHEGVVYDDLGARLAARHC